MSTDYSHIDVGGIPIEIRRKAIKNLHVGVYPPDGQVRVSAPIHIDDSAVRLAIVSRIPWIKKKRDGFLEQSRQSPREMVTGESHYFAGQRYRLSVVEHPGSPRVRIIGTSKLELKVPLGTDASKRKEILERWYRCQLKTQISESLSHWEPQVGITVPDCRVKRMKTLWGSCNPIARRIWLNLELAKKDRVCLEYVLVHEMMHFFERAHNNRFRELMDFYMPDWRLRRDQLNAAPLANEVWGY